MKLDMIKVGTTNGGNLRSDMDVPTVCGNHDIHLSNRDEDKDWDAFLQRTPGGHHVQTSLWARVKKHQGWESKRLVLRRDGDIVAGAQILMRPLPIAGMFGYLPKGPVVAESHHHLGGAMIRHVRKMARHCGILHLVVQPPNDAYCLTDELLKTGFRASPLTFAPTSTVVLDLTRDLDALLGGMKAKTRYNIRLAERQQITVREIEAEEISDFYRLFTSTSKRQRFWAESQNYFLQLWQAFSGPGQVKMFLAQHDGVALSGAVVIAFGDTVLYKRGGWLGQERHLRPNELMHWHIIKWAKLNGYKNYDFEGIAPEAAQAVLQGRPLNGIHKNSVSRFKLGFGGDIKLFPGPFDLVNNRMLQFGYRLVFAKLSGWSGLKRILNRYRTR